MLSYQHIYHAGNLADVHKHALLAWMLDYLTRKDTPISYIETHAGRALYDLGDAAAVKTGEAAAGIQSVQDWFAPDHPYARICAELREEHGDLAYPGSPLLAARLLRATDQMHLAELHPGEHGALSYAMSPYPAKCYQRDGFELARSICPPTPRRGLMLIDPSYEIKSDYNELPSFIAHITKVWNVGVICLWYPILTDQRHKAMLNALQQAHPKALRHEVRFPPARPGHGMIGSGLFVTRPPYGLDGEAARLSTCFRHLN